jgi:hypothetical protein
MSISGTSPRESATVGTFSLKLVWIRATGDYRLRVSVRSDSPQTCDERRHRACALPLLCGCQRKKGNVHQAHHLDLKNLTSTVS